MHHKSCTNHLAFVPCMHVCHIELVYACLYRFLLEQIFYFGTEGVLSKALKLTSLLSDHDLI